MKLFWLFLLSIPFNSFVIAQQEVRGLQLLSLGLNYGQATQSKFPFDNKNYLYDNKYLKVQVNYVFSKKEKLNFELNVEPSIYFSTHQLLNKTFVMYNSSPDFLERRERFAKHKRFQEYVLNIGLIMRYKFTERVSSYLLGSIGPMISNGDTERLKEGFAFSDIFGFGLSYHLQKISFDSRVTIRHNSNANLSRPNHGHNSVGFGVGIAFRVR